MRPSEKILVVPVAEYGDVHMLCFHHVASGCTPQSFTAIHRLGIESPWPSLHRQRRPFRIRLVRAGYPTHTSTSCNTTRTGRILRILVQAAIRLVRAGYILLHTSNELPRKQIQCVAPKSWGSLRIPLQTYTYTCEYASRMPPQSKVFNVACKAD